MKKVLCLLAACSVIVGGMLTEAGAQGKEELLYIEIPQVVTASKRAEDINKAPSVVYVITAEEIKRSGARSLAEILKRVPGMRISIRESSLLGSRGFTSDQNDKYVMLIDGMAIRNVIQDGAYNMIDMPDLAMVERIEVVKGPGSTLWGSDAAFGIINIITKNGADVGGIKVSLDGSSNDRRIVANFLAGNEYDNGDYLFSFTFTDSNGFGDQGENRGGSCYDWNYPSGVDHSSQNIANGKAPDPGDASRYLDFSPGFELYSKLRLGEMTIKSRAYYLSQSSIWEAVYGKAEIDNVMKHFASEIENVKDLGNYGTLTTKFGAHGFAYERSVPRGASDVSILSNMDIMTETGFDGEAFLNKTVDRHHIIAGAKYITTYMGPSELSRYYVASGEANGDHTGYYKYFITLPPMQDNTYGVYLEDNCDLTDRITLVGGLGAEYNDRREKTTQLMPRAAAIFQISDVFSAKYAYNAGYERPPAQKKFGRTYGFVRKSESIREHDLEFILKRDKMHATATVYNYQIDNYFTFGLDPSGNLGHINYGEALGSGIEVDLRRSVWDNLAFYANYTYANSSINGSPVLGEPRHIYNLGGDWYYTKDISVNVNVNGWHHMYHGIYNGTPQYWTGWREQIVDLCVVADNLNNQPLSLTVYANNLFNNKVHVGMTGYPGYTYLSGVSYGTKVSYKL